MDIEIKIPDIGIEEVEIIEILVKINQFVSKEQGLIIVEGEKASMEIPSPYSGLVKEIHVNVSDKVKTGSTIVLMDVKDKKKNSKSLIDISKENNTSKINYICEDTVVHASPLVRRLAFSLNIDLKKILGTGRKNRILKQDIDNYLIKINKKNNCNVSKGKFTANKEHDFSNFGEVKKIYLNKIKQASGHSLSSNWKTIPHVTQFDEVDITDLEKFRKNYNLKYSDTLKCKLTILPFVIQAISKALCEFPYFNSSISSNGKIIFLKKYINISIAVDTKNGLMVPVIKNVKQKSLLEISREILQISEKARSGKLSILDMKGGCFTVSNLGGVGGTFFSPIINSNEAAILGISRSFYKPVWNNETFIPRLFLPLSLSYDHRIVDGVYAVKFISYINKLLSNFDLLLV